MRVGIVRCAQLEDVERLLAFLEKANLGTDGVVESIDYFLIMEDETRDIQATLGIEPHGNIGLLRSLAMNPQASERDLMVLLKQILGLAKEKQLRALYLATNKSSSLEFFSVMGFQLTEKVNLPTALFASDHVKHILTVDNSFFLKLSI